MAKQHYKMNPVMDKQVALAVDVIKKGGVILYPTDTIWGIGCDATNYKAVARVFEIKRRADSKALVTLVANLNMLALYVKEIPQVALKESWRQNSFIGILIATLPSSAITFWASATASG